MSLMMDDLIGICPDCTGQERGRKKIGLVVAIAMDGALSHMPSALTQRIVLDASEQAGGA